MIPKLFKDLIAACNACILSCEACIHVAELCSKSDAADKSCQDFINHAKDCTNVCEACVKACEAMNVAFGNQGHKEHKAILDSTVKELGEHIRMLRASANACAVDQECSKAALEAKASCNRAIQAADLCIESCEQHEVFYLHIKKY